MAVYFVHRTHYNSPSGKVLTRFDDDTVVDWLRRNCALANATPVRCAEMFPFEVYGFGLFSNASQPPESDDDLEEWLREEIYSEGAIICHLPHLITVQSDDDELEFAYYIFDDHFATRYPHRVAFLLHDDWRLPPGDGPGTFRRKEPVREEESSGQGKGSLYWTSEAFIDSCNYSDGMGKAIQLRGVRVPDFARYLACNDGSAEWSDYWWLLRSQLFAEGVTKEPLEGQFLEVLLDDPDDEATWFAYSDWLADHGLPPASLTVLECALRALTQYPIRRMDHSSWEAAKQPTIREARAALDESLPDYKSSHHQERSLIHVDEHVAQLCLHVGDWGHQSRLDVFHHWIFFDDRWAAAHPVLANSILRFTRCWDVLSPDGPADAQDE